ncbi:MAG: hypothetical protein GY716_16070 [bacterium]|nr:hypothetical protein [bacterium]
MTTRVDVVIENLDADCLLCSAEHRTDSHPYRLSASCVLRYYERSDELQPLDGERVASYCATCGTTWYTRMMSIGEASLVFVDAVLLPSGLVAEGDTFQAWLRADWMSAPVDFESLVAACSAEVALVRGQAAFVKIAD